MPSFNNYKDLENWLAFQFYDALIDSAELEQAMAGIMAQAVIDVVYDAYDPVIYQRRKSDGGLSDTRNMVISDVLIQNGCIQVVFENIAEGIDNLSENILTDTIEEGIKSNWNNSNGEWANPRPFVAETARRIESNPSSMIQAIKNELRARGFQIG